MIIGVTGNTGTGKTVICELFEELGAHLISCDKLGWEVLKEPHIIQKIKKEFKEVVEKETVNREKLGAVVFKDKNRLKQLNGIVHPELLKKLKKSIESSKSRIIVVDGALIFELGIENWFDYMILLTSTLEDKTKRLKAEGLGGEIIKGKLSSQGDSDKFVKFSDFIIENDGDLESLKNNAKWVWDKLVKGKKNA